MSEFQNTHRFGFNICNSEIVCPYCGYTYTDSHELSADEDEIECEHCERKFYYGRVITVEYETHNHANYKRCLAMAMWCNANVYNIRRKPLCDMDDHEGWQHDDEFWQRWHKRWLELAEHYKESK